MILLPLLLANPHSQPVHPSRTYLCFCATEGKLSPRRIWTGLSQTPVCIMRPSLGVLEQCLAAPSVSRKIMFPRHVLVTQITRGLRGSKTPLSPSPPHNGPPLRDHLNLPNVADCSMMENASSPPHHAVTRTDASPAAALTPACTAPVGVNGTVVDVQGPQSTPCVGKLSPLFPPPWVTTSNAH